MTLQASVLSKRCSESRPCNLVEGRSPDSGRNLKIQTEFGPTMGGELLQDICVCVGRCVSSSV